jgi:hypothetical protein
MVAFLTSPAWGQNSAVIDGVNVHTDAQTDILNADNAAQTAILEVAIGNIVVPTVDLTPVLSGQQTILLEMENIEARRELSFDFWHVETVQSIDGVLDQRFAAHESNVLANDNLNTQAILDAVSSGSGSYWGLCASGQRMRRWTWLAIPTNATEVCDETTGLIWVRNWGYRPIINTFRTFAEASAACAYENGDSRGNVDAQYRVPTLAEVMTVVDRERRPAFSENHGFLNIPDENITTWKVWTSTTKFGTDGAVMFIVDLHNGVVEEVNPLVAQPGVQTHCVRREMARDFLDETGPFDPETPFAQQP